MPTILTNGRIAKGPKLTWDKLGRPHIEITLDLDYIDDLPLFMRQAPADQQIAFVTKTEQSPLFETP